MRWAGDLWRSGLSSSNTEHCISALQFNHAFRLSNDITVSRAYFDSVYTLLETFPDVDVRPTSGLGEPRGHWFMPKVRHSDATLLHFHGGGYTLLCRCLASFRRLPCPYTGCCGIRPGLSIDAGASASRATSAMALAAPTTTCLNGALTRQAWCSLWGFLLAAIWP